MEEAPSLALGAFVSFTSSFCIRADGSVYRVVVYRVLFYNDSE